MKQAWNDLKSFVTVAMIILLFVIVIANLLGATLEQNLIILVTNLMTAVFTYYFAKTKKDKETTDTENISEDENIEESEEEQIEEK